MACYLHYIINRSENRVNTNSMNVVGAYIMKLKMFIIMGTIVIVGFVFAIWGLLLSAGKTSRHEKKLFKKSQEPEYGESKLRLVK